MKSTRTHYTHRMSFTWSADKLLMIFSLNARKSLRGGHVDESTDAAASSLSMGRLRSRPIEIDAPTYGQVRALHPMQFPSLPNSVEQGNPRMLSIKVDTETTRARDDKSVRLGYSGSFSQSLT